MKGKLALVAVLLAALVGVGVVSANTPPEPTCAAGQVTVTPAVWVPEVPATAHEEYRVWIPAVTTCPIVTWTGWHQTWWGWWHSHTYTLVYTKSANGCHRPTASSLGVPSDLRPEYNADNPEWLDAIVVTPGAWGPWTLIVCHGQGCENRTVTDSPYIPGYWIAPVCREPVVTHDVDCEGVRELVEGVFVSYIHHWALAYEIEAWEGYNEPAECLLAPCGETITGQAQNDIVGEWTAWVYDPAFGTETRSREVTTYSEPLLDAHDPSIVCTPSVPTTRTETEIRDYTACQDGLIATPGEWSAWAFDPQRQVMFRTRSVIYTDALSGAQCGDPVIEETTEGQPACQWNPQIPATDDACQPQYCTFSVTTYWRCNTGNVIWSQETGVTSGDGSNFIGSAPYNRICEWCGDITPGIYHREWRSECDSGSGWDEGTWDLPEWLHTLGGCPEGGRCIG